MFVHEQFAVGQVGVELGDVGLGVGDVRGAAEVVAMIEEDILDVGRVCGDIARPRLRIVRVFGFLPLNGWARDISLVIELRPLHPTFGHRVVAQFSDDAVVAITGVVGVGRYALHRGNTRWRAQLAVILLALLLYLQHAGGIVFLASRNDFRATPVGVLEYAYTHFGGYSPVVDEVVLGETLARNAEYGCEVEGGDQPHRPSFQAFRFNQCLRAFGLITQEMFKILSMKSYFFVFA